jgi:predicted nucleotidyltransferase component of viral defense system
VIPRANILEWSAQAPWPALSQIEQDLIICRALCDIFNDPFLGSRVAFRGGTAINKLLFASPLRYSEDIDLVQIKAEPIGRTIDAARKALAWLGGCKVNRAEHSTRLLFKFAPEEAAGGATLNLKVEVNTREHESLLGYKKYPFAVANSWVTSETEIISFEQDELFGTKLRALLQRRKSRDLFDLGEGSNVLPLDHDRIVASFTHYLGLTDETISRAEAEQRMLKKMSHSLVEDIAPLLPVGVEYTEQHALDAFKAVWNTLIARIAGDPWKTSGKAIEEIRESLPSFLR